MNARDIAIRTILGEAANESAEGQAAVAHVLLNRARDQRWPSSVNEVALQPKQFSAWNSGAGGNNLVSKYGPGDEAYERAGAIYDQVVAGQVPDPTGGATHYYSPAGMSALVNNGDQSNLLPRWLQDENARRGGNTATIGGHIFTGLANGAPSPEMAHVGQGTPMQWPQQQAPQQPETVDPTLFAGLAGVLSGEGAPEGDYSASLSGLGEALMGQQQPMEAPQIIPVQAQQYQPKRREISDHYLKLFQTLRG